MSPAEKRSVVHGAGGGSSPRSPPTLRRSPAGPGSSSLMTSLEHLKKPLRRFAAVLRRNTSIESPKLGTERPLVGSILRIARVMVSRAVWFCSQPSALNSHLDYCGSANPLRSHSPSSSCALPRGRTVLSFRHARSPGPARSWCLLSALRRRLRHLPPAWFPASRSPPW